MRSLGASRICERRRLHLNAMTCMQYVHSRQKSRWEEPSMASRRGRGLGRMREEPSLASQEAVAGLVWGSHWEEPSLASWWYCD